MKELMFQKELTLINQISQKKCIICRYWHFKYFGYKFESHVSNKFHDILMMAYQL